MINTTNIFKDKIIQNIYIISDSQNCINIIKQSNYTKDEVLIEIHEKICKELNKKIINELPENYINIQWVKSHQDSKYNEEVDMYSKIAAILMLCIADNDRTEEILMNPNNYISYNTIKSEIKYKINNIEKKNMESI